VAPLVEALAEAGIYFGAGLLDEYLVAHGEG
jgi:hypothetical protein